MQMIRHNWTHYRDLYHIAQPTFRNDYALSIALGIVSGQTLKVDSIPWSMPTVVPESKLTFHDHSGNNHKFNHQTFWNVKYQDAQGKNNAVGFIGVDFHAMGKKHLGDIIAATC
jgi:hypothetical protein